MVDLAQWLRAQLDEDTEKAQASIDAEFLTCGQWLARGPYGDNDWYGNIQSEANEQIIEHDLLWPQAVHIAEWDPARVLREIDSRRRTLIRCEEEMFSGIPRLVHFAKQTVREMAVPYEGRPGYAEAVASYE